MSELEKAMVGLRLRAKVRMFDALDVTWVDDDGWRVSISGARTPIGWYALAVKRNANDRGYEFIVQRLKLRGELAEEGRIFATDEAILDSRDRLVGCDYAAKRLGDYFDGHDLLAVLRVALALNSLPMEPV